MNDCPVCAKAGEWASGFGSFEHETPEDGWLGAPSRMQLRAPGSAGSTIATCWRGHRFRVLNATLGPNWYRDVELGERLPDLDLW